MNEGSVWKAEEQFEGLHYEGAGVDEILDRGSV